MAAKRYASASIQSLMPAFSRSCSCHAPILRRRSHGSVRIFAIDHFFCQAQRTHGLAAEKWSFFMKCLFLVFVVLLAPFTHPAVAADTARETAVWPQFRGPGGNAVGMEGLKYPVKFGKSDHLLWKTDLPP